MLKCHIYPNELYITNTTKSKRSASYLLNVPYNWHSLTTLNWILWQTWWFKLSNCQLPFLRNNKPSAPSYEVYISQLFLYAGACSHYINSLTGGLHKNCSNRLLRSPSRISWPMRCVVVSTHTTCFRGLRSLKNSILVWSLILHIVSYPHSGILTEWIRMVCDGSIAGETFEVVTIGLCIVCHFDLSLFRFIRFEHR